MKAITTGRKPTLGEVLDYYTREDFLTFMFDMLSRYRVVAVISERLHWEPDWERDEVRADSIDDLRRTIVEKITRKLPTVGADERPHFYPSFHQSVWQRPVDDGQPRGKDCVFEADLPTWRDSFRDVGAAVTLMAHYGVRYRHKFSGHRSLHIVIPAGIVPRGFRGTNTARLAHHITRWSSAQAHYLPQITRMPYSLNEDTGLVCLPIARRALAAFRPWMANLHLVDVRIDGWHEALGPPDTANLAAFIQATETREASADARFFVPDVATIAKNIRERDPGSDWARFTGIDALPERTLLADLDASDPDARWLALEAFLLRGTGLSRATIHNILSEGDEYARVAATDVLLRFEDDIFPTLVKMMGNLGTYSTAGAQAAYLLTQSDNLRRKVLDALVAGTGQSAEARIAAACLAGAMANDWPAAMRMLAPLEDAEDLSDKYRAHVQALRQIATMGTWSRRDGAAQAQDLAALGPDVTDIVLLAAGSPNRRLRRDLVGALAELRDPRSVDLLVAALSDDYSRVRRKAISALVRIGEPAIDALVTALGSDQSRIRKHAVVCLGQMGKNETLAARVKPAILHMLDDSDEEVRRVSVRALTAIVTEADLERLVHFIGDATWENGQLAVELFAVLGAAGREAMEKLAFDDHALPAAAYYLAREGDARGGDVLARLLASEDARTKDAALHFLAELRDSRCVPYLAEQLQTLVHWRAMWYAHRLGEIGTTEAVDGLIAALERDHKFTHRGAARGLGLAKDPRAIPHLIRCLGDADGKTRSEAANALVAIGEASIAPLQATLVEDTHEARQLQNRIRHTLKRLGVEA